MTMCFSLNRHVIIVAHLNLSYLRICSFCILTNDTGLLFLFEFLCCDSQALNFSMEHNYWLP